GTGIAEPVDDRGDDRTHRQHAVSDDAVEADLPGESLVPVDRIVIARGRGVVDQRGSRQRDIRLDDGVSDGQLGEVGGTHSPSPLTTRVSLTVTTGCCAASVSSVWVVIMALSSAPRIRSTWVTVASR